MTDLPSKVRQKWASEVPIDLPLIATVKQSFDGTEKYLVTLGDGQMVETVSMLMRPNDGEKAERLTACISTQVGCALGCTFCATGTMGLKRHLSAGEIAGDP